MLVDTGVIPLTCQATHNHLGLKFCNEKNLAMGDRNLMRLYDTATNVDEMAILNNTHC